MPDLIPNARVLRKDQTKAEALLWRHLRNRRFNGLKFRRQHPVPPYIADFCCEEKRLIIELDGGQHSPEIDKARTAFLEQKGYGILRFWNNELFDNIEGVLHVIQSHAEPNKQ